MIFDQRPAAIAGVALLAQTALAGSVIIEPDFFPSGTVLTNIDPRVALSTANTENDPVPIFEITATDDSLDYAPTGANVFAHVNIPFFNEVRRLRMDFTNDVRSVALSAAGGDFFDSEVAMLRVYNAAGQLLQETSSAPLAAGQSVVISISRPSADIAFAVAFTPAEFGNFLRLDRLVFEEAGGRVGDIDGDSDIDVQDLALLLAAFGLCEGQSGYSAATDLDGDDCVTLQDLASLLAVFGT